MKQVAIVFGTGPDGILYTCPCKYQSHHYMCHCTSCGAENTNLAK